MDSTERADPGGTPAELLQSLRDDVVWEADVTALAYLYVSPSAGRLLGYPLAAWTSDQAGFWIAHLHPDDRERCLQQRRAEIEAGRDHELEYRMIREDGEPIWVRDRVYLVRDEAGAVTRMHGIMTDITRRRRAEQALRESEARLRLAVDAADLGTWDMSIATREMVCSRRCCELFDVPPGAPITDQTMLARIHPEDRERSAEAGARAMSGECPEFEIEFRVARTGEERWLLSRGKVHFDDQGRAARIIGTVADITERVRSRRAQDQLLDELRAEKQRAEQASRAKDEFLAMLGHELRNPLAPILTALEVMALNQAEPPGREETVIRRQVNHLVRLVDDLLDVSRITSGQVSLDRRRLDLADVIRQAIEIESPLYDQRRHHLTTDVPRGVLFVMGDELRLVQVIANLLDNAARYTPPSGRVVVRARQDGDEAAVVIEDSGIGILPELLPRVFDLFVQAERAPDRAEGGLGIGLSLVRTLAGMHGGTIAAESEGRGRGSRFELRLPITTEQAAQAPRRGRTSNGCDPARSLSILVVDDNEDAADLLAEVLRTQGHDVQVAHDAPQALERVMGFHPEVAVLDIGLPVMDGYELAIELRRRLGPGLRLLAVTGYGQERDRARSREVGFDRHFVKPVPLADLLAALDHQSRAA